MYIYAWIYIYICTLLVGGLTSFLHPSSISGLHHMRCLLSRLNMDIPIRPPIHEALYEVAQQTFVAHRLPPPPPTPKVLVDSFPVISPDQGVQGEVVLEFGTQGLPSKRVRRSPADLVNMVSSAR